MALRAKFRGDMDRRWAKMRRLTLDALGHSDVLGLSANPLSIMQSAQLRASMSHAPVAGQDKVKAFQGWMDAGLHQVVFGYSGTWLHPYIGAAVEIAKRRAAGLADEKPITTDAAPRANRLDTMCSLATTELQGICEAVSQQACRELAAGLLQGKTPKRIAARVANRVARVGKVRGRMLANTIVVSTHAGATLDEFRARGITHVGTKAERKRRKPTADASFITDRNTDGPSAYAIGKAEKGQASLEEQFGEDETVDVLNADDPCPECEEISADGPYGLDEAESLIPAHPNAVLEGSTIASYGAMHQMVRARFAGPAICLRTSTKQITIGPNHPMLTRRGFVKARDLNKSDELLYDLRTDCSRARCASAANLKKMPVIEDIFEAFWSAYNGTTRATSHLDLHGDGKFCEGKIEVVSPTGELLPVLDPGGLEHSCKRDLVRSNVQLFIEACFRGRHSFLARSLASANRVMSILNLSRALSLAHGGPLNELLFGLGPHRNAFALKDAGDNSSAAFELFRDGQNAYPVSVETDDRLYRWDRVLDVHSVFFSGLAFDASTETGMYNSDGYVVKNCECAFVPTDDARFADVRELDT